MKSELEILFNSLGFNETQLTVYLSLVSFGKASATQLSKNTKLPRSTIYSSLDNLLPSGLVSLDQSGKIKYFVANAPESIERYVSKKKELLLSEITEQQTNAKNLIELLKPHFTEQLFSIPKMQFFEGEASISNLLYENTKVWQDSVMLYDGIWWGYQDHNFVESYRGWLDYYWKNMKADEKIQLLSNKSSTEKKLKGKVSKRIIKVVPKQFEFSSTIWILGDYIISISTRQKPHYAFQVKDTVFSANLRKLFQMCWGMV
jgi:sugar-specific transcriptional regulator TrmB